MSRLDRTVVTHAAIGDTPVTLDVEEFSVLGGYRITLDEAWRLAGRILEQQCGFALVGPVG